MIQKYEDEILVKYLNYCFGRITEKEFIFDD